MSASAPSISSVTSNICDATVIENQMEAAFEYHRNLAMCSRNICAIQIIYNMKLRGVDLTYIMRRNNITGSTIPHLYNVICGNNADRFDKFLRCLVATDKAAHPRETIVEIEERVLRYMKTT